MERGGPSDAKERLLSLADRFRENMGLITDPATGVPVETNGHGPTSGVILTRVSDVKAEPVRWAWKDRIPLGGVTLLAGVPGLGKSTVALELAARLSRGQAPGDLNGEPVTVAVATAEDHKAAVVRPRLEAAGADLDRVLFVEVMRDGLTEGVSLPDDVEGMSKRLREAGVRVFIVDPLMAHLGGGVDSWKDQSVRRALAPLARMAEDLEAAVLSIVHFTKSAATDLLSRVGGSVGITGAARSVMAAAPHPSNPDGPERVIVHVKSNMGPEAVTLRFRIEGRRVEVLDSPAIETSGVLWTGEDESIGKQDLILQGDSEERADRSEAAEWLRDFLVGDSQPATTVLKEGKAAGFSEKTLRRAKKDAGVRVQKIGFEDGRWVWTLPHEDGQPPSEDGLSLGGGHLRPLAGESPQVDPEDGQGSVSDHLRSEDGHLRQPDPVLTLLERQLGAEVISHD